MRDGPLAPTLDPRPPPGGSALRLGSGPRATLCALFVLLACSAPAQLRAEDTDHIALEGGLGTFAAVTTIAYAPLKLVYALGGLTVGALAYLWTAGNSDVTDPIFQMALGGDYVVSPEHLAGNETFELTGE